MDNRSQEVGTNHYIYRISSDLHTSLQTYCEIGNEEYYNLTVRSIVPCPGGGYLLPTGIMTAENLNFLSYGRLRKNITPNTLKNIVSVTINFLAPEIIKIIKFDMKVQKELMVGSDVERNLLKEKRAEIHSEYYEPFQKTLVKLFNRLEQERLLLLPSNLLSNPHEIDENVSLLLNTKIDSNYHNRQRRIDNLLESFKELDEG